MRHYVHYHNPDVMGYDASEVDTLNVLTNKRVNDDVVGERVWLLTGRGKPREYFLCLTFIADQVGSGPDGKFRTMVSGTDGTVFDPFPRVDQLDWFGDFRKEMGNFAFGFQAVKDARSLSRTEHQSAAWDLSRESRFVTLGHEGGE